MSETAMGDADRLVLRPLRPDDEPEAVRANAELAVEGVAFLTGWVRNRPFTDYLAYLERQERGEGLPNGRIPSTFLVGDVDGMLVGRVAIRHGLSDLLRQEGGHVGYAVRPRHRNRGYATRMLELSVEHLRSVLGIERVLVTCDDDNLASATVIERCGGRLEGVGRPPPRRVPVRRYWIE